MGWKGVDIIHILGVALIQDTLSSCFLIKSFIASSVMRQTPISLNAFNSLPSIILRMVCGEHFSFLAVSFIVNTSGIILKTFLSYLQKFALRFEANKGASQDLQNRTNGSRIKTNPRYL